MLRVPVDVLEAHQVRVTADNPFQQRARLLQALWRESRGFPGGAVGQSSAGSRLAKDFAYETHANLLTPAARDAAERELEAARAGSRQLISEERLWTNLLSSQPLAFNLFAALGADLGLATRVLQRLLPDRIAVITHVGFEHSPGRGDVKYTGDHTAFDVYFEHTTPAGGRGFVGLEVKYHEGLGDPPAKHRPRYDEVTRDMACFKPDGLPALRQKPVEQLWRDHMLAGSMHLDKAAGWESGLYVFLYPEDNEPCRRAAQLYRELLLHDRTFAPVTLEAMVDAMDAETESAAWVRELRDRYLGWEKVDAALAAAAT
jgi:hypothetical protein